MPVETGSIRPLHPICGYGCMSHGCNQKSVASNHSILIPSSSTARIQEMHITVGHILCDLIEKGLGINS